MDRSLIFPLFFRLIVKEIRSMGLRPLEILLLTKKILGGESCLFRMNFLSVQTEPIETEVIVIFLV